MLKANVIYQMKGLDKDFKTSLGPKQWLSFSGRHLGKMAAKISFLTISPLHVMLKASVIYQMKGLDKDFETSLGPKQCFSFSGRHFGKMAAKISFLTISPLQSVSDLSGG